MSKTVLFFFCNFYYFLSFFRLLAILVLFRVFRVLWLSMCLKNYVERYELCTAVARLITKSVEYKKKVFLCERP